MICNPLQNLDQPVSRRFNHLKNIILTHAHNPQMFFQSAEVMEHHIPGLAACERTYYAENFQLVHNTSGSVVAQLHFTLDQ